jgi:serine/threonine-protein kinase
VFNEPAVAPDGRRIAVVVGTIGRGDVWTYEAGRQLFSRLTFDGRSATPYWARDGQTIYYASIDPNAQRTTIMRKRIDGSAGASVVATLNGRGYLGYMDPDERFAVLMVVPVDQPSDTNVVKLPITPSGALEPIAATEGREYGPTVSPNGRWVAFVSTVSGQPEVYVRELDGTGQWQVSTSGGVGPRWSADGRELYYRNDTRQMAVALEAADTFALGASRLLFEGVYNFRTEAGMNYDVDPVSGRFLVVSPLVSGGTEGRLGVRVILNYRGRPVD